MKAAKQQVLVVTGSSGLIGSEVVEHFCHLGWNVHGVDNNMRADFFGPKGDTRWNLERLRTANLWHRITSSWSRESRLTEAGRSR
jgi:nucleoside-diphosphate-sugar epimerase